MRCCNYGTSDAYTNEPSGEDLCIRHVAEYSVKAGTDLESCLLDIWTDLMGLEESLDEFGYALICGSCSFSPVTILS